MAKKKSVRKIILIKDWGPMKKGKELLNPNEVTIRTLCYQHKFGKLVGDPDFLKRMKREEQTLKSLAEDVAFSKGVTSPKEEKPAPDMGDIVDSIEDPAPKTTKNPPGKKK